MKSDDTRTCLVCGTQFPRSKEFCPICILREAMDEQINPAKTFLKGAPPNRSGRRLSHRFEHYELITDQDGKPVELGRGAMGVTYKAFDVDLRCPVTLKVISERYLGDESARLRFLREARAAASLRHSNLASCCTWVEPVAVTSTRWSSWREKRSRTSSNAQAGLG
jgi:hypothetical protein